MRKIKVVILRWNKTIQIISIDRCDDYTLDGVFILAVGRIEVALHYGPVFYAIDFFNGISES